MIYPKNFDIIVIGGGHAGIEAAMIASKIGCYTLLLTNNIDTIGQMSCNPAIGGIGKGHLVKEIDAMGGLMALAADRSGIQFKILNYNKGPAIRSTRAQIDRKLYFKTINNYIRNQNNLIVFQQIVKNIIIKNNNITGVITKIGLKFNALAVIITSGTFLNGKIYIGSDKYNGGRAGDPSFSELSNNLKNIGFKINRLKTGTPPRIDIRSIDFSKMEIQEGDNPIPSFSFINAQKNHPKQISCYITHTNENTHKIIQDNINLSPVYSGFIKSVGPRYCPSIEDKIVRFPNRKSHRIFLEPEGLNSNEIYPNGISTSLPFNIQMKIIRSIKGLEKSHITRSGYAIEYDFFDPKDLKLTLESKLIKGLFFAGQVNGTTGYEEAAAQGIIAGLNASNFVTGKDAWWPRRDQAYLGVLIDDLCKIGTEEPYRMFTSRAEYRLILREDNADLRLTEIARKFGMIDDERWRLFCIKQENIELEHQRLKNIWINPNSEDAKHINLFLKNSLIKKVNGEELLTRPEINYDILTSIKCFSPSIKDKIASKQIEIQIKYKGYIIKQQNEIKRHINNEYTLLPINIDYKLIHGLSNEAIIKFNFYKPNSIGQASRIPGITPSNISILLIWLKKNY